MGNKEIILTALVPMEHTTGATAHFFVTAVPSTTPLPMASQFGVGLMVILRGATAFCTETPDAL